MEFNCLPTAIGSMPHTDPARACATIAHYLKEIPNWPQLPKRGFRENMYVQYSQGFPGVVVTDDSIHVDRSRDVDKQLEALYTAYLANDIDKFPISPDNASGLYALLAMPESVRLRRMGVKGQITGPVTWGMTVTDNERKPIIYDEVLGDAVPKLLRLKAGWMEKKLREVSKNTIIFVDEPSMSAYGSVAMSLSREKVVSLLEEVLGGITGVKGIHCCGNTDWPVLLGTSIDIISFDTYNYAQSLSLYPAEVKKFLERGGSIAWGIVPNDDGVLAKESVASLNDRLDEAMAPFTRNGISIRQLRQQSLLTPSCGLAALTEEAAERALSLLAELSALIRRRYLRHR